MSTSSAGRAVPVRVLDLTLDRSGKPAVLEAGMTVVLGAPVYAGRLAPEAVRRLKRIHVPTGAIVPTVVTVTYGNRDYEDALVEMYDLAVELGLSPIAAGAFIGEHSYSTPELPIAEGRPDSMDLADARIFGGQCLRKLESPGMFAPFTVKGNRPYKPLPQRTGTAQAPVQTSSRTSSHASAAQSSALPGTTAPAPASNSPATPVTADGCPLCGECAGACPTGAIALDLQARKVLTDSALCIRCCACVKACQAGMRTFDTPFAAVLHDKCAARRNPETFM